MAESRKTAPTGTQYVRLDDGSVKPIKVKARLGLVAFPEKSETSESPAKQPSDRK